MTFGFALRMAFRELRSSARRLGLFFAAVGIGTAAMVVLRSAADSIRDALLTESRFLLAADVSAVSSEGFDEPTAAVLEAAASAFPLAGVTRTAQVATLARSAADPDRAAMVELKGLGPGFPLHGDLEVEGVAQSPALVAGILADGGALVRPELLPRLGLEVGDALLLAGARFEVRGVLAREPGGGINFFARGPKVLVALDDLLATGVADDPARGRREILFSLEDGARPAELATALRTALEGDSGASRVRVRTYRDTGERLARRIRRAEDYLSLAGFVILVLGAVGVFSVVSAFTRQNLAAAATLRCLGVHSRTIFLIAALQVAVLAGAAGVFGIALAAGALTLFVPPVAVGGIEATIRLTAGAALSGALAGGAAALLASVFPLLPLRRVRPLGLLRSGGLLDDGRSSASRARRVETLAAVGCGALFFGLAGWQSGSFPVTLAVTGGFVLVAATLWFLAAFLLRLLRPLAGARTFPVRHAVRTVLRGAAAVRLTLVAVGVGVFLVLATAGIERNLRREFAFQEDAGAPDVFFLDIQADQREAVEANARRGGAETVTLLPVLQARIEAVFGPEVSFPDRPAVRRAGMGREYTVSSRSYLEDNETVTAGEFWGDRPADGIEVSAEIELWRDQGLRLGDTIRFRILGETLDARITSFRDVEWRNARNGGFTFLFHPDNLEDFPRTWAGFVKGPDDPVARSRFIGAAVGAFPNITVVDLRDVLQTFRQVADSVALAIRIVGLIALIGGALILIGTVAVHIGARRRETAVLRVLGAARNRVFALTLIEHGALGAVAGGAAVVGAAITVFFVVRRLMRIPFAADPVLLAAGVLLPALAAAVVGAFAAADVLRRKPLAVLRE